MGWRFTSSLPFIGIILRPIMCSILLILHEGLYQVIINSTEGVAVEIPADVIENAIDINGPVTFDERATFSDDGSSSAGDGSAVLDPENWEYLPK